MRFPHEKIDAHADLDAKDVVRRAGQFRIFSDVATEVEDVDQIEVFFQLLPHSIKGFLGDEAVVVDETDDAAVSDAVAGVADGLHIRVGEFAEQRGFPEL